MRACAAAARQVPKPGPSVNSPNQIPEDRRRRALHRLHRVAPARYTGCAESKSIRHGFGPILLYAPTHTHTHTHTHAHTHNARADNGVLGSHRLQRPHNTSTHAAAAAAVARTASARTARSLSLGAPGPCGGRPRRPRRPRRGGAPSDVESCALLGAVREQPWGSSRRGAAGGGGAAPVGGLLQGADARTAGPGGGAVGLLPSVTFADGGSRLPPTARAHTHPHTHKAPRGRRPAKPKNQKAKSASPFFCIYKMLFY